MTDGWTDGRTDGGDCNIPDAFLKKRGDNNNKEQDVHINKKLYSKTCVKRPL